MHTNSGELWNMNHLPTQQSSPTPPNLTQQFCLRWHNHQVSIYDLLSFDVVFLLNFIWFFFIFDVIFVCTRSFSFQFIQITCHLAKNILNYRYVRFVLNDWITDVHRICIAKFFLLYFSPFRNSFYWHSLFFLFLSLSLALSLYRDS